jgi:hypothetical protein
MIAYQSFKYLVHGLRKFGVVSKKKFSSAKVSYMNCAEFENGVTEG